MAKRRLLQWMRDRLNTHASSVVIPKKERRVLDAAYKQAAPRVRAIVEKRYPAADMKVLRKYSEGETQESIKVQFPNGAVTEFKFDKDDEGPHTPSLPYGGRMFVADAATAAAVEKWEAARDAYKAERDKRLVAYRALIDGAGYVEDIIDVWPEAKEILPAGSPPIPLGPEQIALVRADHHERTAA